MNINKHINESITHHFLLLLSIIFRAGCEYCTRYASFDAIHESTYFRQSEVNHRTKQMIIL